MARADGRPCIYLDNEEYRQLRVRLILVGKTVSQWVREQIRRFLSGA